MTYLRMYVLKTKKRRFKRVFNMITGKNASKILAKDIS